MASVPFSNLNSSSLLDAVRESIRESRQEAVPAATHDMSTAKGQMDRARERGLRLARITATGQEGWITWSDSYDYHVVVRIAGAKGRDSSVRLRIEEVDEIS